MDENKKTKEPPKVLDESELEAVAGGSHSVNCYFVPEHPIQHNGGEDGEVSVKCGSRCAVFEFRLVYCSCHGEYGRFRCIDKWHIVDHVAGEVWAASPLYEYNHMAGDKVIKDGSIPHL